MQQDYAYPLVHMNYKELNRHCVRIMYYKNRIAVECFHSVTDGTGGMMYLENLVRRYLQLSCGITCPDGGRLLSLQEEPSP